MSLQVFDELTPTLDELLIENGDGTALQALTSSAPARGARIDGILLLSDDTVSRDVEIALHATGTPLCQVSVPAGTGFAGVAPIDVVALLPGVFVGGLVLAAGQYLDARTTGTVTAAKKVIVVAMGGTF